MICPDGLAPAPVAQGRWTERRDYLRALEGPGPEEWPWTTFAEYLDALDATRPAISLVPSIGHGAARDTVIGGERRPPTREELEEMRREVRAGFEAGATNLSFGLVYLPGAHAETDELVAVAEVAAEFGKPIVPHVRNEGEGLLEAIDEMLEVSHRSGASLHLSHLKSFADEALIEPLLEKVEGAGLSFDQYPYGAGCTLLASLLPAWAQEGGAAATLARMRDPDTVARIAHDVEHGLPGWENLLATSGPGPDPGRGREPRRPRRRPGRDGRGAAARVRARRADGHALRRRRGGPEDRRAPADAARLGRDLRPASAPTGGGQRGALPGAVRDPRRARDAGRRRSRG